MAVEARTKYFDRYWRHQDLMRVSARAVWRTAKLHQAVGDRYSSLLDIGAGQGELLSHFQLIGYDVTGWDISAHVVADLRREGFRAKLIDLERDELTGEYELISCCEVLQQVRNPDEVMRKVVDILAPGGRLFVSIPNEFHILRCLGWGKPVESHVSLFSPRRALKLAAAAGLQIEKTYPQPLIPPRWGRFWSAVGELMANLIPSLFSLSTAMLLKKHD
ncbi:MAG: class I SAM-dependent methyltransferase [candidate division Zixibacteria bacterium]|nr:class I SAM-dependent methyltransferase [candidate division Zixibacteria bacterium]